MRKALVFQFCADFRHDKAERAGQHQHHKRDEQNQQKRAEHSPRRGLCKEEIHHSPRNEDNARKQQAEQICAEQAGRENVPHGNRHGEEQVVVLRHIQPRKGVEHAAEHAERCRHQRKQHKIQPAVARRNKRRAEREGKHREDAAEKADHEQRVQRDVECCRAL